jgi:hypothetical protein
VSYANHLEDVFKNNLWRNYVGTSRAAENHLGEPSDLLAITCSDAL